MGFGINKYATANKTANTVLLLALAVLMLVVSCPVKRLLQNNFSHPAPSLVKTYSTKSNYRSSVNNEIRTCSYTEEKVAVIHSASEELMAKLPTLPAVLDISAGYGIPYFLSTIGSGRCFIHTEINASSLPLFLQQSRLLI